MLILLAALLVGLTGCARLVVPVEYEGTSDSRNLTLIIEGGVDDVITSAKVVSQTADAVVVEVKVKDGPENRPALGVELRAELELDAPLGDRTVQDVDGVEVPRRNG